MLSKLTVRRAINLLKLTLSYRHSLFYRKVWMWGMPWAVSLEPNNTCNLRCSECPTGTNELQREKGLMSPDLFGKILAGLPAETFYLNLYFMGEPFLHPGLFEMIGRARSRKIYINLATNGHFLTESAAEATVRSGLDRIVIGLDGSNQEDYASYRKGGDYELVVNGIKNLVKAKRSLHSRRPFIVLQVLLLSTTENRMSGMRDLGRSLGADRVVFKKAQFYHLDMEKSLMPEDPRKRRYSGEDRTEWKFRGKQKNACFRMWHSAVVSWEGKVLPCCFDKDARHVMGDLKEEGFRKIWKGRDYIDFRKKILHDRGAIAMCSNCTEGARFLIRS
ncbi:MAG TPA: radical SAM/SPASM domain-containing protein [Bacteroidales bacterium]|nr:radical SAM/SPASM domain-containing protein [Bacteroidales bacterium]HSA43398.1 radical SAM/SPASM domain-containing protein [Bacteroidales bacterium]